MPILLLVIFFAVAIYGLISQQKKDRIEMDFERENPGGMRRIQELDRERHFNKIQAKENDKKVKEALRKGEKISFWDVRNPMQPGSYKVKQKTLETEEFWDGVKYDIRRREVETTANWDGIRWDKEKVKRYWFEMK
jgi:hypothetical protein